MGKVGFCFLFFVLFWSAGRVLAETIASTKHTHTHTRPSDETSVGCGSRTLSLLNFFVHPFVIVIFFRFFFLMFMCLFC